MSTAYEADFRRHVEAELEADPELVRVLLGYLKLMRDSYPRHFTDSIAQKWREDWDLYDAYAVGQVIAAMTAGEIGFALIPVADSPFADKLEDRNRAVLAGLPSPFRASVCSGSDFEGDGSLAWRRPARFRIGADSALIDVDPGRVPLEIGYTNGARSLLHIRQDLGLARWPYDHDAIAVFVTLGQNRYGPERKWERRAPVNPLHPLSSRP